MARDEYKPEKVYDSVYVATITKDNKVILQNRNYEMLAEVPIHEIAGFLLQGVCVCQRQKNWQVEGSESFWFCLDKNTNERAIAEVWDGQVVMRQPGSSCEL